MQMKQAGTVQYNDGRYEWVRHFRGHSQLQEYTGMAHFWKWRYYKHQYIEEKEKIINKRQNNQHEGCTSF